MELFAKQVKNTPKPSTPQSLTFLTFVKNLVFDNAQDTWQRLNIQQLKPVDSLFNLQHTRADKLVEKSYMPPHEHNDAQSIHKRIQVHRARTGHRIIFPTVL